MELIGPFAVELVIIAREKKKTIWPRPWQGESFCKIHSIEFDPSYGIHIGVQGAPLGMHIDTCIIFMKIHTWYPLM